MMAFGGNVEDRLFFQAAQASQGNFWPAMEEGGQQGSLIGLSSPAGKYAVRPIARQSKLFRDRTQQVPLHLDSERTVAPGGELRVECCHQRVCCDSHSC